MIDSRELRIGNKVKVTISNDAGIYEVLAIPAWGMNDDGDGKEPLVLIDRCPKQLVPESKLKPISLTPEILIAAGFENDGGEFQHPDNTDFDLMFYCSENGLWCAYNFGDRKTSVPFVETTLGVVSLPICNPFKYVHQLQNLYFALTQTEITINLK